MRLLDDLGSAVALRSEPNLTERVTERLLSQLTAGQYQPGDVLPSEQLIAEHMGVSRTVLREAVARLKAEGYVISKQGRGLIVQASRRPTVLKMHAAEAGDYNEALSIVELRQGFEMVAAALAAHRRRRPGGSGFPPRHCRCHAQRALHRDVRLHRRALQEESHRLARRLQGHWSYGRRAGRARASAQGHRGR